MSPNLHSIDLIHRWVVYPSKSLSWVKSYRKWHVSSGPCLSLDLNLSWQPSVQQCLHLPAVAAVQQYPRHQLLRPQPHRLHRSDLLAPYWTAQTLGALACPAVSYPTARCREPKHRFRQVVRWNLLCQSFFLQCQPKRRGKAPRELRPSDRKPAIPDPHL